MVQKEGKKERKRRKLKVKWVSVKPAAERAKKGEGGRKREAEGERST